jgi:hypothetical protein
MLCVGVGGGPGAAPAWAGPLSDGVRHSGARVSPTLTVCPPHPQAVRLDLTKSCLLCPVCVLRLDVQVGIATLVGRYQLSLAPEMGGRKGFFDRVVYHITLQAEGGMPLVLTPRVKAAA